MVKILELSIVIAFYLLWVAVGVYYARRALSKEEQFLVAGRSVGPIINALAILAVYASAGSFMGGVGVGYKTDIVFGWMLIVGSLLGYALAMVLTATQLRKAGVYTASEFLNLRYGSKFLVFFTALIIIIGYIFYIVSQIKAIGIIGEYMLDIPYEYGILIGVIVFAAYTAFGGMPATTLNQAIQGALMLILIIAASITALNYIGWFPGLSEKVLEVKPSYLLVPSPKVPLITYVGAALIWACTVPVAPHVIMRFFTAFKPEQARASCALMNIMYSAWMILNVGITATCIVLFPPSNPLKDPDFGLIAVMERFWSPFGMGLIVAGILAGAMSTIAGQLVAIIGAFTRDILLSIKPTISEKTRVRVNIITCWIVAIIVLTLGLNPPELLVVLYTMAQGLITITLFFPILFGIWWKRFNKYGAIAASVSGAVLYIVLNQSKVLPTFGDFVVALPISLVVGLVVTLITPKPSDEIIKKVEELHK